MRGEVNDYPGSSTLHANSSTCCIARNSFANCLWHEILYKSQPAVINNSRNTNISSIRSDVKLKYIMKKNYAYFCRRLRISQIYFNTEKFLYPRSRCLASTGAI